MAKKGMMKLSLYASISLNCLLIGVIAFAPDLGVGWRGSSAARSSGVPDDPPAAILPSVPDEYWTPRLVRDFKRQSAQASADEKGRQHAIELHGQRAVDDPAFRALFRPLDAEFPFLSSAKQIELQRLQIEVLRRRAELLARDGKPRDPVQIHRDFDESLLKLLTPEELFEYQLRTSPAAQALLSGGFQFQEQEFRDVFRAVTAGEEHDSLPSQIYTSNPAVLAAIRKGLSDDRFAEYQRSGRQNADARAFVNNAPLRIRPRVEASSK